MTDHDKPTFRFKYIKLVQRGTYLVYLPDRGWVEFDPRDLPDASPLSGAQ